MSLTKNLSIQKLKLSTGDSNLNPFYIYTEKDYEYIPRIWEVFEFSDMKTYFSPDMKTAVVTFEADGAYIITETNKTVSLCNKSICNLD